MRLTALSDQRLGDNLAIEQHGFGSFGKINVPNDVDKNKHMQSALPQSSLNQCLGVIHKLISNVQPCRIVKRLKELHCIFFFLVAKLKENKTQHTYHLGLFDQPSEHTSCILCLPPPDTFVGVSYRRAHVGREKNTNTSPQTAALGSDPSPITSSSLGLCSDFC